MRQLHKQCKTTKGVNAYLRKIGLADFEFDEEYNFPVEYDFDGWLDEKEIKGVSIQVTSKYEVSILKYSRKDLDKL